MSGGKSQAGSDVEMWRLCNSRSGFHALAKPLGPSCTLKMWSFEMLTIITSRLSCGLVLCDLQLEDCNYGMAMLSQPGILYMYMYMYK
jgi:hypothetical protein